MRESPIERSRVELSVGDSVRIDEQILTVLEINDAEVTFRIDVAAELEMENVETVDFEYGTVVCDDDSGKRLHPR